MVKKRVKKESDGEICNDDALYEEVLKFEKKRGKKVVEKVVF